MLEKSDKVHSCEGRKKNKSKRIFCGGDVRNKNLILCDEWSGKSIRKLKGEMVWVI